MATLRKTKVGKYTYWQIVESKRVNGKPRPVVLMHLGTADKLLYKLTEGPVKKTVRSASHGAVWLLFKAAEELGLKDTFYRLFGNQVRDGQSVGQSLLLAAIHRAVRPGSKKSFSRWAKQTTLPEIARFNPEALTSQHFWDQMDTVTEEQIEAVETEITAKMIDRGLISTNLLFYDLTNFFTYIDTENKRSQLAQRGRNKQKRHDLRQFGLIQVATQEFLIPVFSEVYEGNVTDKALFIPFITRLRRKISELNLNLEELTVVFDKGSNTRHNFAELDKHQLPYVASLTPGYHVDLLEIDFSNYRQVTVGENKLFCYKTAKQIWGKERTVVIYISEKLRRGQLRGLKAALQKKNEQLQELKQKLNAPRAKKKKRENVEAKIKDILKGERGELLICVFINEISEGHFDIDWEIDPEKYRFVTENIFGKKLLVTCRDEWSEEEIIKAYFGQSNVERVFKNFKNPYHHAIHPQFHWTDQKIRVHTFICITGLLLSQVIWKKAREAGYNYSIETLLDRLAEVRQAEIVSLTGFDGKPCKEVQLEEMDPELLELYHKMDS